MHGTIPYPRPPPRPEPVIKGEFPQSQFTFLLVAASIIILTIQLTRGD